MSDSSTANLEAIAGRIRQALAEKNQAREAAYPLSREAVRSAANCIRAVHRGEFEAAKGLLAQARSQLGEIGAAVEGHPDLRYTGYVESAEKEYAEAAVTFALAAKTPVPEPEALGVSHPAYLNALGEAAGEMRRYLLDHLRREDMARCEAILASMDDIYNVLVTMDFPDALTAGLRRTTDMVRGVLERTRGDFTMAVSQARLVEKLTRVEKRLEQKT